MSKLKYILFSFGLLSVLPLSAQQYIGVEQYMQKVLDYSHQLKIAQERTAAAMSSQAAAKTGFLPKLDANGNYTYQFKKIGFDFGGTSIFMKPYSYQAQVTLVETIYGGNAITNQYQRAKITSDMAGMTEELTLDNVAYAAEYNYWNLAANEELLDVSTQNLGIVRKLYDLVNERFSGGLISRTDVMMVETRLKEAEYQHANIQNSYKVAEQNFNVMMGEPVGADYAISDTILRMMLIPQFMTLDEVLEKRPDYQIANKQIEYDEFGVKLARSKYNPQLVAGAQGQWGTQMLNFDGKTLLNGAAYLQLNIPIFHWNERRHTVSASRAQLNASERQKLQVVDDITLELNNAITMITETAQQVSIADASLKIASENLELNTFSYNEGKLTILDVLSAQTSWLQSYTNAITANLNHKLALAQYKKVVSGGVY